MPKDQPEDILSEYLPNGMMRTVPLKDLVGTVYKCKSVNPVYKDARAGLIPTVKIGGQAHVPIAIYNEMLRERAKQGYQEGHAGRYDRTKMKGSAGRKSKDSNQDKAA